MGCEVCLRSCTVAVDSSLTCCFEQLRMVPTPDDTRRHIYVHTCMRHTHHSDTGQCTQHQQTQVIKLCERVQPSCPTAPPPDNYPTSRFQASRRPAAAVLVKARRTTLGNTAHRGRQAQSLCTLEQQKRVQINHWTASRGGMRQSIAKAAHTACVNCSQGPGMLQSRISATVCGKTHPLSDPQLPAIPRLQRLSWRKNPHPNLGLEAQAPKMQ